MLSWLRQVKSLRNPPKGQKGFEETERRHSMTFVKIFSSGVPVEQLKGIQVVDTKGNSQILVTPESW